MNRILLGLLLLVPAIAIGQWILPTEPVPIEEDPSPVGWGDIAGKPFELLSELTTNNLVGIAWGSFALLDADVTFSNITGIGYIQAGSTEAVATNTAVGAMRYRSGSTNSFFEVVMQTGSNTYEWVEIVRQEWSAP